MATVAERFGMSLERLIDLNADLAHVSDEDFIKENMQRVSLSLSPPLLIPPPLLAVVRVWY